MDTRTPHLVPGRPRLLCVDDEPHVLRALVWLLGVKFEIDTATSAAEALALLGRKDYDVVMSDQRMPGVTGVELLREVRRRAPRAMRILLTGYSDLDAMERSANESEVFRFLTKPWSVQELVAVVSEAAAIARRAPAPPAEPAAAAVERCELLLFDESPDSARKVADELRDLAQVHTAAGFDKALEILARRPVAVVLSETSVGGVGATRLIRVARYKNPATVCIVLSAKRDAEEVMALVNEGQVFRLVPKPAPPGFLRLIVEASLRRHRELREQPQLALRYGVVTSAGAAKTLERDAEAMDAAKEHGTSAAKQGWTGILRRLIGRDTR